MKKLSGRQRRWLIWHALRSNKRRLEAQAKKRRLRTGRSNKAYYPADTRIPAPRVLSLTDNYEEVCGFFDRLLEQMIRPRHRTVVDFTTLRRIGPRAALMLAATLDMWQRLKGIKLTARDAALWHPDVRRLLVELGLFDLLKTSNPPRYEPPDPTNVLTMLKFCSGEGSDGSLANELTRAMIQIAGPIEAQRFLYVGLTEAMTNVAQHAYPDAVYEGVPPNYKRWWMTGSYDPARRCMRIHILDLGVGIPATLPKSGHWEAIRGFLLKLNFNDDADMIGAAVEIGRSSTGAAGRGYGLDEIRQFVENSTNGRLRILSGRGEVTYEKGGAAPLKRRLETQVSGTLIEWEAYR